MIKPMKKVCPEEQSVCVCVCVCVCWGNKCITQLQNMTCIFGRLPVRVTILNV